jgi:cytochrome c553
MYHKSLGIIFSLMLIFLSGCGDKQETEDTTEAQTGAGIVVTENAVKALAKEGKSKENSGKFYYSYNKEKKEDEDVKVRTELDAYRDIKSPYERIQITLMIKQLSPDYHLLCSACHDDYANGIVGPALLDKNATFIYDRMMAFKTGAKKNPLMQQLVNRIDTERLKNIAKEIERFNKAIKEMRSKR